ncbi:MAG: hypothetical protein DIZ80_09245 [endosymbiont of Galathealinum brachiosum]|uniref:GmrSD restriction endonucleases N-terminal domain-containing protein n=1 Tax=endosymbiont of Galathealinum brachiosum TaxID=2200906 RepID=A0A370DE80_9GAMM|nr:MAG: hypothetical protein DIZ80_09245 [endosymbiont of Galathealinum brachiosum]
MLLNPLTPDVRSVLSQLDEKEIDLDPEFQRGDVWNRHKQQMLIDTILRDWEIPPIFLIINEGRDVKEVLDGHQRLKAIHAFHNDGFKVNGSLDPADQEIRSLDGCLYSGLPERMKKRFRNFSLRIFEISNYVEGEPFELFFRLNQNATLTSAERRNTFFGEARDATKDIVNFMDRKGYSAETIGFNNTRLGYHDVIARVLISLEKMSIQKKLLDKEITSRYRSKGAFSENDVDLVKDSLERVMRAIRNYGKIKLNKPSLFSLIVFVSTAGANVGDKDIKEILHLYMRAIGYADDPIDLGSLEKAIINQYSLRISTSVYDSRSVIFRSFFFCWLSHMVTSSILTSRYREKVIATLNELKSQSDEDYSTIYFNKVLVTHGWGEL